MIGILRDAAVDQTVIHNPWEAVVAIVGIAAFAWVFVTVIKTARR